MSFFFLILYSFVEFSKLSNLNKFKATMQIKEHYNIQSKLSFNIPTIVKKYIEIDSKKELIDILKTEKDDFLILGGGSNYLFTKDYDKTILKINIKGIELLEESENYVYLKVGAGEEWDPFVAYCVAHQYWGVENLSLIPGTIGGAAVQNIGAYGVEAQDIIFDVRYIQKDTLEEKIIQNKECSFGYRDSIFKKDLKNKAIITEVVFRLHKKAFPLLSYGPLQKIFMGKTPKIEEIRESIMEIRKSKLPEPQKLGNAGSFFKNPIINIEKNNKLLQDYPQMPFFLTDIDKSKLAAAWLIEQAGWKGYRIGDAGVHEKQALVLVNYGNAKGEDIYLLSEKIKQSVFEKFGVNLEREVIIIS